MAIKETRVTNDELVTPRIETAKLLLNGEEVTQVTDSANGADGALLTKAAAAAVLQTKQANFVGDIDTLREEVKGVTEKQGSSDGLRAAAGMSDKDVRLAPNSDVLINSHHLTYLISPLAYKCSGDWRMSDSVTIAGRTTLLSPAHLVVALHSSARLFVLKDPTQINLSDLVPGKDYYIYLCDDDNGTNVPSIKITDAPDAPEGYTDDSSRKVGGFHTLCEDTPFMTTHGLSDYRAGDPLPASVWDLNHRPLTCSPEGMVYHKESNLWVDIYLGAEGDGKSSYGSIIKFSRSWYDSVRILQASGKRMLTDVEFSMVMAGSPEEQAIRAGNNRVLTGLNYKERFGIVVIKNLSATSVGTQLIDTYRGSGSALRTNSIHASVDSPIAEFSYDGLIIKNDSVLSNANDKIQYECFSCSEEELEQSGILWKYNPDTGFGFCIYEGDGASDRIIYSPADRIPMAVFIKNYNSDSRWPAYVLGLAPGEALRLNTDAASQLKLDEFAIGAPLGVAPASLDRDTTIVINSSDTINASPPQPEKNNILYGWFGDPKRSTISNAFSVQLSSVPMIGPTELIVSATWTGTKLIGWGTTPVVWTSPTGLVWTKELINNPYPANTIRYFTSAASDGIINVVVGANGEIQTSTVAGAWTHRNCDGNYAGAFRKVVWTGSMFVVVGDNGEIQTSPNGIIWAHRSADLSYNKTFRDISFQDNFIILVGDSGEIQSSGNGINWKHRETDSGYTGNLSHVATNGNIFVAVGESGEIQTSTNGKIWTSYRSCNTWMRAVDLISVVWNGSIFIAIESHGGIQASTDGIVWVYCATVVEHVPTPTGAVWDGTAVFLFGAQNPLTIKNKTISTLQATGTSGLYGTECTSMITTNHGKGVPTVIDLKLIPDKILIKRIDREGDWMNFLRIRGWERYTSLNTDKKETAMLYPFEVSGSSLILPESWATGIYYVAAFCGESSGYNSFTQMGGYHEPTVGVVSQTIATGANYTADTNGCMAWERNRDQGSYLDLTDKEFFGGRSHISIGKVPTFIDTNVGAIKAFHGNGISLGYSNRFNKFDRITAYLWKTTEVVRCGSNTWYINPKTGYAYSMESGTGLEFTTTTNTPAVRLLDVAFNGYLFVAVGDNATIVVSFDGISWIEQHVSNSYSETFFAVASCDEIFIAVGELGEIQTSIDGLRWTAVATADGYSGTLYDASNNDTLFLVVGESGEIQTSPDSTNWTSRQNAGAYSGTFRSVVNNSFIFVAVGEAGEIQTSPNGVTWTHQDNANGYNGLFTSVANGDYAGIVAKFVVVGEAGEIQTSPDGINWTHRDNANGFSGIFFNVYFSGGIYFAIGSDGEIQTSEDGLTWIHRNNANGSAGYFYGMTASNSVRVIVGEGEPQVSLLSSTTTIPLPMDKQLKLFVRRGIDASQSTWPVWFDGCPIGKTLVMESSNGLFISSIWNNDSPFAGAMPIQDDGVTNDPSSLYLNQAWFEPDDPTLIHHDVVAHTAGTDTTISTLVENIAFVLIKATDISGGAWLYQDHHDWSEVGELSSATPMGHTSGLAVNVDSVTIPEEWPTATYLVMIVGEDLDGNFKAVTAINTHGLSTSGAHVSEDGQRMVSHEGVEDATGILWQDLLTPADHSSDEHSWGYDSGSRRTITAIDLAKYPYVPPFTVTPKTELPMSDPSYPVNMINVSAVAAGKFSQLAGGTLGELWLTTNIETWTSYPQNMSFNVTSLAFSEAYGVFFIGHESGLITYIADDSGTQTIVTNAALYDEISSIISITCMEGWGIATTTNARLGIASVDNPAQWNLLVLTKDPEGVGAPDPYVGPIRGATMFLGEIISVGGAQIHLHETDGSHVTTEWADLVGDDLYDIAVGTNDDGIDILIVVGADGVIRHSTNTTQYTLIPNANGYDGTFKKIIFTGSMFVIAGEAGEIQTSPNGVYWTSVSEVLEISGDIIDMSYCSNQIMLVDSDSNIYSVSISKLSGTADEPIFPVTQIEPYVGKSIDCSSDPTHKFNAMAYDGNMLIVVGEDTLVYSSTDKVSWEPQNFFYAVPRAFASITWGGGWFLAVGDGYFKQGHYWEQHRVGVSRDGVAWEYEELQEHPEYGPYKAPFSGSAFNGSYFVVIGSTGVIQYSSPVSLDTGPVIWTEAIRSDDGMWISNLHAVTWTGSMFVAVGETWTVETSPDGIIWTYQHGPISQAPQPGHFNGIAGNKDLIVAVGDYGTIQTSEDGVIWTKQFPTNAYSSTFNDIIWDEDNRVFVAIGESSEVQWSPDGIIWTRLNTDGLSDSAKPLRRVASVDGELLVTTGTNEILSIPFSEADKYRVAVTGKEIIGTSYVGEFNDWAASSDALVFVGSAGEIQTSPNGDMWIRLIPDAAFVGSFLAVTWGDGIFVTVGEAGEIQTSPDGIVWEKQSLATPYELTLHAVAWGNGIFVSVGESGEIRTSPDGAIWTHRNNANGYDGTFFDVHYNGNIFLAVGEDAEIQTSPDGLHWYTALPASVDLPLEPYLGTFRKIACNGNNFIIVGDYGEIQVGTLNGEHWTKEVIFYLPNYSFKDLVFIDGIFLAMASDGNLWMSIDGAEWKVQKMLHGQRLNFISLREGMLIFAGKGGTIVQLPFSSIPHPADNGRGRQYSRGNGGAYRMLAGGTFLDTPTAVGTASRMLTVKKSHQWSRTIASRGCAEHYSG